MIRVVALAAAVVTSFGVTSSLPRSTPEETSVDSKNLLEYINALDEQVDGMHSIMVVHLGQVIAEGWWTPYTAEARHTMYSLSKSFTSTAVGLAQAEGKLSIDDTVVSFFPELVPANASANLKAMRVRDLLCMSSGHHNEDIASFNYDAEDAVKQFLAIPVAHKPGTHFVYNTPGSFMLSAIVQKATGEPVLKYLRPRLFDPLGIENAIWDAGKSGINLGGYGLHIRTEDIAKFGLLYSQEGNWDGKQLLQTNWVRMATTRETSNGSNPKSDWDQGYGFQFWRCRNDAYRGDGAFGQYCVVMQDQTVVAITSGVRDMQKVLDVTWEKLLPALRGTTGQRDEVAQKALKEKLRSLKLRPITGAASSEALKASAGKKFKFESNKQQLESLSVAEGKGTTELNLKIGERTYRLECGPGEWRSADLLWAGISSLEKSGPEPVSASGAWAENILTAKIAFTETPYVLTLKMDFGKGEVKIAPEMNVAFGQRAGAVMVGRAE